MLKVSEFRKNLAEHLQGAHFQPIVVQDAKNSQLVVVDVQYYNRLSGLWDLYREEDPEGAYKQSFVKEMKGILKDKHNIDPTIHSLKDI